MSQPRHSESVPALFRVRPRATWRFLRTQPASFWLMNFYLFLEYVRPQTIWPWLDVIPWAQTTLILATIAFFMEGKMFRLRTVAGPLLMGFSAIVALSSFTALDPGYAIARWELFYSWILIYLLITNTITTEKRFFVFLLAFLLYSFKMSQHGFRVWAERGFGFAGWGLAGPGGWFQNSGELAIQMCIFLPLSVEFVLALRPHMGRWTRWLFYFVPVTAIATIVASSSRGGLVGAAALGVWWVARSKRRVRVLVAVVFIGAATWAVVPAEQKTRFSEAGEDDDSVTRIERWQAGIAVANQYPVLGIGYKNWSPYFGGWLSHNIFIEAMAELGYTGLLSFLSLITATFWINARTRKLLKGARTSSSFMEHMAYGLDGALIGYMASGFFVTVLYYPFFWINLAMTVSLHTAGRHEVRRLRRRSSWQPRAAPVGHSTSWGARGPAATT